MTDGEFKDIFLPCYRKMYAVAYSIFRNADDASDTVQDVISVLWQGHNTLSVPEKPVAFCCQVTKNACIDRLRRDSKRYFDSIESAQMVITDSATDSAASYTSSIKRISGILSKFKEKQRKILCLNIFSQLSTQEISNLMGESEKNIRTILCRGRKKIKELLNDER